MKYKKSVIIFSFIFILFGCQSKSDTDKSDIGESDIKKYEGAINSEESINSYFKGDAHIALLNEITADATNSDYGVLADVNEKFAELSNADKYDVFLDVIDVLKRETEHGDFLSFNCENEKENCILKSLVFKDAENTYELRGLDDTYSLFINGMEVYGRFDGNAPKTKEPSTNTPKSSGTLAIEETSCSKDGDYMNVNGYVKNNSETTYSFIKVQAEYFDSLGNIVDTDFAYAVGSEGLTPNGRKSFSIMTRNNESIIDKLLLKFEW